MHSRKRSREESAEESASATTPSPHRDKRTRRRPEFDGEEHEEELTLEELLDKSKRPSLKPIDPTKDAIIFQQIEADYTIAPVVEGFSALRSGQAPVVRMYGVTQEGNSVLALVHGVLPYFYIPAPSDWKNSDAETYRKGLDQKLRQALGGQAGTHELVYKVEAVSKSPIMPYRPNKSTFLKITLTVPKHVARLRDMLEVGLDIPPYGDRAYTTYESNIPFALRFMIDHQIVGANWLELPPNTYKILSPKEKVSHCQLEIHVHHRNIISRPAEGDWSKIAPLRILSFDIECAGRKGVFPEPDQDPVIQIASYVTVQGDPKPFVRTIFTLRKCASVVGAHVLSFEKEEELLLAWRDFVHAVDPDLVSGYNIMNFDLPYLINRARRLGIPEFAYLCRIIDSVNKIKEAKFSSKAFGTRESKEINMDGRVTFDVLQVIQREFKLRSYSLNSVSAHFLGEQKEEVHHSIITDLFNGTPEDRRRLAIYCLKDAYLPQRLLDKLMCVINYIEMARVTGVPLSYLLTRGQQVKVISQLYRTANREDLIIPCYKTAGKADDREVAYQGATVIEPLRGYYTDPIATLDFTSLYPSIMMAHNLCYSTLIADDPGRYPEGSYERTPAGACFVKAEVKKGVLPRILEELLAARQRAKEDLKNEKDPFKRAVLDGRQLALKISANSVYGFTGATIGKLPCMQISASVTAYGRMMIELTRNKVEEHYPGASVIYGDSVTSDTALVVRRGKAISTARIDELVPDKAWEPYHNGKEAAVVSDLEVWQDGGFTPVTRIIRHVCSKPIVRVLTHTGIVDCTTDHSLLRPNGDEVRPVDVAVGADLLHAEDSPLIAALNQTGDGKVNRTEAFAMGMFVAKGSCAIYHCSRVGPVVYSWGISHRDLKLLKEAASSLPFPTAILDTAASSGIYTLVPDGDITLPTLRYRALFYNLHSEKRIPPELLGAELDVIAEFWRGFYAAHGYQAEQVRQTICHFDQRGKELATGLWLLGRRLGWTATVNELADDPSVFRLSFTDAQPDNHPRHAIQTIRTLAQSVAHYFIYDLETGSHHFHVGPGDLVVHNTDSVMVKFSGVSQTAEAMRLGKEASRWVTSFFPRPINLDFEKVYCPFLLITKKRYAGLLWMKPEKYEKIDAKGIETVRRDNCPLVKTVITTCLDKILIERNVEGAIAYAKQMISDLLCNRLDISMLVISKALSKSGEDYKSVQAHVELAEKMRKRDAGSAPAIGDRVPYVVVKAHKGAKAYEKAEDPLWVLEHNIPLDTQYYLEQQLAHPLTRIFEPIMGNVSSLLKGEHTRTISMPTPSMGGIVGFTQKKLSCLGCKAGLAEGETTVCQYCKPSEAEIFQRHLSQVNKLEREFSRVWTQCQSCQGSLHQEVLCTSRDCPIFYMRMKIKKDLKDCTASLERFHLSW